MDYPASIVPVNHVAPVPRRIRAYLGARRCSTPPGPCTSGSGRTTRSTTSRWTTSAATCSSPRDTPSRPGAALAELHGLRVGDDRTGRGGPGDHRFADRGPEGTVRFEWAALDAWFEEDEQVFVHPRNPYTRVDALRSNRRVRVELDGVVLAESASPVMVFETGLPTRYYVNRTDVRFEHLVPSDTVTSCPYKGMTSGYWSVRAGGTVHKDLAWAYDFPTRQLLPIAGLVAFYNEMVDTYLDGERLDRPQTHFSRTGRDGS